jgi:hypothetical protein
MPEHKGHKAESDVEPEAHESRSRAAEGEEDGSYVGAAPVPTTRSTPAKRAPKRAVNNRLTLARRARQAEPAA